MVTFFHHCPPLKNLTIHVQIVSNSKALVSAHATFRIRTTSFPSARLDMILRTQASSPEPQSAQGVTCALLHANHFPSQSHSMSNRPHLIARITRNRPTSLALGLALLLAKTTRWLGRRQAPLVLDNEEVASESKQNICRAQDQLLSKARWCRRNQTSPVPLRVPPVCKQALGPVQTLHRFSPWPTKGFTLRGACRLHPSPRRHRPSTSPRACECSPAAFGNAV